MRRAVYILKDFEKIPTMKGRAAYANKTQEIFQTHAEEFMEKNYIEAVAFVDGISNIGAFIPLVTICFVFDTAFLVYDIFTNNFYTYDVGLMLLNDQQIVATANPIKTDLPCDSLNVCRYLLGLNSSASVSDKSPFYKFVRQYL